MKRQVALLQAILKYFREYPYFAGQGFRQPPYSNTLPMGYLSIIFWRVFPLSVAIMPLESSGTDNGVSSRKSLHEDTA